MKKEEDSEEEKEEGPSKDDINDMFNTAAEIKSYQLAQERKKFDSLHDFYKDGLFNAALNSEGKCYNYYYNNSEHCFKYEFIKDKDNKEKLTCVLCITGYYLNSENKCISFIDKIEIIPNCLKHSFNIKELAFYFNYSSNDLDIHLNENSSKLYYDYTYIEQCRW